MIKKKKTRQLLVLFGLLFCLASNAQSELYIATNGNDSNDGSIDNPLATLIGARDKARTTGAKTIFIREGHYNFDTTCELGSEDSGVTFSGYQDEKVILDGSGFIDSEQFEIVSQSNLVAKLHSNAVGKVYSQIITNSALKTFLEKPTAQISMNDKMMTVARFPNNGYGHIVNSTVTGADNLRETGTDTDPKGATFEIREPIDASKWNAELSRLKKAWVKGYFSAEFFKEDIPVNSVSSSGQITLTNGTWYDIKLGSHPNRLFAYHLLCELDEPGEWYYDNSDSRLYIWPTIPITDNTSIGTWAGPQCFEINDGQDIQIKKMTIQNVGSGSNGQGAINVIGASRNILIAGITFRFIASPLTSVNLWDDVKNSKVLSCDFYDVSNNSRLYGGGITSTSVTYGNNVMENCHFTQVYSKDFYGKACGIRGAGNIFRNNLIHNMNGQPLTFNGVDHVIELNEAFNTNIEEGDGGMFYSGGDLSSFGNTLKHNFFHHNMTVPQLLGKGAIHLDDIDAGDNVYENIFYKAGWAGVKMNKAGGHSIQRNVFIENYNSIRNNNNNVVAEYDRTVDLLVSDPNSTTKNNYIGRMLQRIGVSGWQTGITKDNWPERVEQFWYDRYPRMQTLYEGLNNNDVLGAHGNDYTDNMFLGSIFRDYLPSNPDFAIISGTQAVTLDLFTNPSTLNFKFNEPRPGYAPNIPFENVALYLDEYRCAVPDKNKYRQEIKQRFDGLACFDNSAVYDFDTITERLYYNSGEEIFKSIPCTNTIVETGDDSYIIKATGESCPDKDNGKVKITAKNNGTYVANLNGGADINFVSEWVIEDLIPGTYDLCITNTANSITQCFSFEIEEGTGITGKTTQGSGKVAVEITEGTAPFNVFVNGEMVLQTSLQSFSVKANNGDVVEVKSSIVCEGSLNKTMDGIAKVSPNPTEGAFEIELSMALNDDVKVEIYNVYSQLVSSKLYPVSNGKIQININEKPAGIYFSVLHVGNNNKPKVFKIIKK
ncbi:T9SS type A sorting domain-containing protein [Flavivirga amylovorans]|uniref:T9SS type A sorting domain-containing protein n=1 Tax=Flavivirga amylovorans TaxID=870486 RepID=A0ABT8WX20_9FLAO|nr:T9SS type A sorting domain-containing protein [Flavivirga amylovorans]MDO5986226.1 T9SS type A sorting domain-containing protein [Flavivirga amylovorans]